MYLSICLSIDPSIYLSYLSILLIYLTYLSYLSILLIYLTYLSYLSILLIYLTYLSYLSTSLPIYLSTYLPSYPSTYLPIHLSTYPPIHLSMYLCMHVGYIAWGLINQQTPLITGASFTKLRLVPMLARRGLVGCQHGEIPEGHRAIAGNNLGKYGKI